MDSLSWIRHKEAATLSEKSKTGEQYKFSVGAGLESGKTEVGVPSTTLGNYYSSVVILQSDT